MRWTRKLLYTVSVVVVFAATAEGLARLWEAADPPAPPPPPPQPGRLEDLDARLPGLATAQRQDLQDLPTLELVQDPVRGWSLRPDQVARDGGVLVRVNALGLRGADLPPRADPDELRLLTLGDSSIFGYGVSEDQVFGAVAAAALTRPGRPAHAANGGMHGYTSDQSLRILKHTGPRLEADWVVIANLWSDLYASETPAPEEPRRGRVPLASYRLALRALAPLLPAPTIGWLDPQRDLGTPAPGREARTGLHQYRANLEALVASAEGLGARPAFVSLPAPVDLHPQGAPSYILAYRAVMQEVAEAHDAPLLDGPALFRSRGATNAAFLDQVHPSAAGHALLGEALAQLIDEQGEVPP